MGIQGWRFASCVLAAPGQSSQSPGLHCTRQFSATVGKEAFCCRLGKKAKPSSVPGPAPLPSQKGCLWREFTVNPIVSIVASYLKGSKSPNNGPQAGPENKSPLCAAYRKCCLVCGQQKGGKSVQFRCLAGYGPGETCTWQAEAPVPLPSNTTKPANKPRSG